MRVATLPNRHGVMKGRYRCGWCGCVFDVTPDPEIVSRGRPWRTWIIVGLLFRILGRSVYDPWENCLDVTCPSYDPGRDANLLFDPG